MDKKSTAYINKQTVKLTCFFFFLLLFPFIQKNVVKTLIHDLKNKKTPFFSAHFCHNSPFFRLLFLYFALTTSKFLPICVKKQNALDILDMK